VPATSANLGAGFDAVGVALDLRGEIELSLTEATSAGRPVAPAHPEPVERGADRGRQMALEAAECVFQHLDRPVPTLQINFYSDVPVARGLGASAIVRTGVALAAFALAGAPPEQEWLLETISALEGHADNAVPALLGGLQVVVIDAGRVVHVSVPLAESLRAVLFVPDLEMSTDEGRRLLPASLSLQDAVHNSSRAALLVAGLAAGRYDVLKVATDDRLHQPARAQLFPAMYQIFQAAADSGALCAFLSGGGSSILAMTAGNEAAIMDAMKQTAAAAGVSGHARLTGFSERGAEIVAIE